ncbi:hypothetical protein [Pseudoxanthomonas wuyuanensis]
MGTETRKAWWRELGAISQGMLFIDGHIAVPQATEPAQEDPASAAADAAALQRRQRARQDDHAKRLREMTALSLFR